MFRWLRALFSRRPAVPPAPPRPAAEKPAAAPEPPAVAPRLVRGRMWANTSSADPAPARSEAALPPLERLIAQLGHRDSALRERAAVELGALGDGALGARAALVAAAVDVERPVRVAALVALDALDPRWPTALGADEVRPLVAALGSRFTEVWQHALVLLVRVGPGAVEPLREALRASASDETRVVCLRALGRLGAVAVPALPDVLACLAEPVTHVRREAADALAAVGPCGGGAAPALLAALGDSDVGVRRSCLCALARVGGGGADALPALVPLFAD